ncbi:anti-sigma factor family protein [Microbacterium rhizosphaerae]|uniref:Zf-HC2 domain-containing protein n=1 Tax=Microbacterium rhizosphaerae TaxID=1678237 RepID=A0ABZ0SPI3_9MICO|nr:zf-HC2 domain-containing protein [Microbacterium rhizosphaerae]WPR90879.1 zf-HC2 domain-containing protein [Microbacterium rhizosphaerae]
MTDCGCEKAQRDLEEYLRNEVCTTTRSDIEEHLAHCTGCQDEAHVARTLTEAVARACVEYAPDELREQVLATIRAADSAAV